MVAAGVLAYGVHDLQEARFLPGLGDLAFDVSDTIDANSWYGTLLKGVFNFSPATTKLEAAAWLLYAIPVMTLFLITIRRRPKAPSAGAPGRGTRVVRARGLTSTSRKSSSMRKTSLVAPAVALLLASPFLAACTENADPADATGGEGDVRAR